MAEQIQRNNVSFVGGDFNMALFVAKDELKAYGIDAVFLGSYAWRQKDTRGSGVEGLPGCRYDSLALFAVRPVSTISRLLRQAALRGIGARDLDEFEDAHGYPSSSYLGGEEKILAVYQDERPATHGSGECLPHIKQKALRPQVWDATGHLQGRGAHMPLLFYVGERGRRTETRLDAREINMIRRGWGPASLRRNRLMERQGRGRGEGEVKGEGAKGKGKGKDKGEVKGKGKGEVKGKGKDKGEVKGKGKA